jgi:hypothetical protein
MRDVKRSIVIPVEMAQLLDRMAKEQDLSFTGVVRMIVRQWSHGRQDRKGGIWLGLDRDERRDIRKVCRRMGVSRRAGSLMALRRGLALLRAEAGGS